MLGFFKGLADRKKNQSNQIGLKTGTQSHSNPRGIRDAVLTRILASVMQQDDPDIWDAYVNHLITCKEELSSSFLRNFIVVCPVLAYVRWAKEEYDRINRERHIQFWDTTMERVAGKRVDSPKQPANSNSKIAHRPVSETHHHGLSH